MRKVLQEWFIQAPWGKIALISWGTPTEYPVLLVHGNEDSAATFIPLLDQLPDKYYYVALDLPGMGHSDPFPPSVMLMRFHNVTAVELVVKHLKWTDFAYIGHSLGTEVGLLYNAIFPHQIKKMILLDPNPPFQRMLGITTLPDYFRMFLDSYYSNYDKLNNSQRVYSKSRALEAVIKARGLTEEQAEIILSRNLTQVGEDLYRLSWDKRLRFPATWNFPEEYYYELFSKTLPATLMITAKGSQGHPYGKEATAKFIKKLLEEVANFNAIKVEGGHDVHFTNPERVSRSIREFLRKDFEKRRSKL